MFSERFDSLMSIAEVSNTRLARAVNLDGSYVGRLRTGARALSKKHDYLAPMCRYLAKHIRKEYQLNALQKLTGISPGVLAGEQDTAIWLEGWLTEKEKDISAATGRLISGFSRLPERTPGVPAAGTAEEAPAKYAAYLYGNAGKRKAVEQFFLMILQENEPQTLLLFSDEDMAWLNEDAAFAARWAELFKKVIMKGNRVRIIHTVSRDMDHMLWSVTNWLPIYMTGAIEPYCYNRLRDGLFQQTMFIAPRTAAVISSSVQKETEGMLNLFVTDRAALEALTVEYERLFALCRPLIHVYSPRETDALYKRLDGLRAESGDACLSYALPPLFALPESLVNEANTKRGNLLPMWEQSVAAFQKNIRDNRLSLTVLEPDLVLSRLSEFTLPFAEYMGGFVYTREQYLAHYKQMMALAEEYSNLSVFVRNDLVHNMLVYVKEETGALKVKTGAAVTGFVSTEKNMVAAFWDTLAGQNAVTPSPPRR